MCGIIGIIGKEPVADRLIDGIRRLEYRGYDSTGIATVEGGQVLTLRAEGKLVNLEKIQRERNLPGLVGIGHTRWATHGAPTETNAHPHATDQVAVVHNGIIENFQELRKELTAETGHRFASDTDTEVVPVLITHYLSQGLSPQDAVARTLKRLEGAYALAIIFARHEGLMIGARKGSPLAVGFGKGEMYLGSDAIALAPLTNQVAYLEEGDWVEITREGAVFHNHQDAVVERAVKTSGISSAAIGKDGYRHYMQKEIFEQPTVMGETLTAYLDTGNGVVSLPQCALDTGRIRQILLIACGTSYYAASVASYWLEKLTRLPVTVHISSEFRYRNPVLDDGALCLFISQSGETADTLAALRLAKEKGAQTAAVVNSPESSMAHEAGYTLHTMAGPEIGVASTKAFTTQLIVLAAAAIHLGLARGSVSAEDARRLTRELLEAPAKTAEVLSHEDAIKAIAAELIHAHSIMYIGRGMHFPIALEGALKLKEISYIHAEGYAAGELKHGPIALLDEHVPVVAIAPDDSLYDKTASNIQEVAARHAPVVLLSSRKGIEKLGALPRFSFEVPEASEFVSPILYAIPVQLLAYHVAVAKGTDVDQPRNLAKSVTVE